MQNFYSHVQNQIQLEEEDTTIWSRSRGEKSPIFEVSAFFLGYKYTAVAGVEVAAYFEGSAFGAHWQ